MSDPKILHDRSDAFHAHLDACEQCREHPFALCAEGEALIEKAGRDLAGVAPVTPEARR